MLEKIWKSRLPIFYQEKAWTSGLQFCHCLTKFCQFSCGKCFSVLWTAAETTSEVAYKTLLKTFGHLLQLASFNNWHFEFCCISVSSPNFQHAGCDFKAYFTFKSTLNASIFVFGKELIKKKNLDHCDEKHLKRAACNNFTVLKNMYKPAKVVVPLVVQRVLCWFRNVPERILWQE